MNRQFAYLWREIIKISCVIGKLEQGEELELRVGWAVRERDLEKIFPEYKHYI